jgi:hypothetical protein
VKKPRSENVKKKTITKTTTTMITRSQTKAMAITAEQLEQLIQRLTPKTPISIKTSKKSPTPTPSQDCLSSSKVTPSRGGWE